MIAYRVDDREYKVGGIIQPRLKSFLRENDPKHQIKLKVEQIFDMYKPLNKPSRNKVLMVFTSLDRAKHHWLIYSGSSLYKVEIESSDILHQGDFNKVEELFKMIESGVDDCDVENLVRAYWSGEDIKEPEFFVSEAIVVEILGDDLLRKRLFSEKLGYSDYGLIS